LTCSIALLGGTAGAEANGLGGVIPVEDDGGLKVKDCGAVPAATDDGSVLAHRLLRSHPTL